MIDALEYPTRAADAVRPAAPALSRVAIDTGTPDDAEPLVFTVFPSHFRPVPAGVAAMLALFSADPSGLRLDELPEEEGVERVRATLYELGGMAVIA